MNNRLILISLALIGLFLLSACAIHSEPSRLQMQMPEAWSEQSSSTNAIDKNWWFSFDSTELNALVDTSLSGSPDLAIAAERIKQAEASLIGTRASLFPSLNLSGNTGRRWTEQANNGSVNMSDSTGLSVGISYEADLWGRLSAGIKASQANLQSSRYDYETARLTLIGGVANAYFQVLAVRAALFVARENLAIAERLLRIVDVRYRNGAASALDLSRQQTTVLAQRAALKPLEVQERQLIGALAVLLGRVPEGFNVVGHDINGLTIPEVATGLPSDLLVRRPDLAKAESLLIAADANLYAARAALLPGINLSGSGGLSSSSLLALTNSSTAFSLAASLSHSIFDGGRLRSQVDISDSQRLQLLETYRKTILTALQEVETALSNAIRFREQEIAQLAIRDEAQRSLRLAELRYREGADDLTSVLDAQRTLYSAQDQLTQIRLSRLSSAIDIIKALGGGWEKSTGSHISSMRRQVNG